MGRRRTRPVGADALLTNPWSIGAGGVVAPRRSVAVPDDLARLAVGGVALVGATVLVAQLDPPELVRGLAAAFPPAAGVPAAAGPALATVPLTPAASDTDLAELTKAVDRRVAESAAAERVAVERAAAERVAVERAAAERAATETAAAETAAAQRAVGRSAGETDVASGGGRVQIVDARVTSGFGMRSGRMHNGLDLAAPIGTPIRVPLSGEVLSSGPADGFGLWVRVRHDDGTITVYGHVDETRVRVGQRVSQGDVIATVGNRGRSTGPHLHIEVVSPGGTKVDPRRWLDERGIGY